MLGPPSATWPWSGLMSAARTASYSSPTSMTRLPVLTSQTTAWPDWPPRPPPARSRSPLRLNFRTWIVPSGNGRTPTRRWSVVVEQDLLLPADRDERGPRAGWPWRRSPLGRALTTTGSGGRFSGIAGGPGRLAHRRGVELELDLRLGLDRDLAAGGLEGPRLDPLLDHLELGVGELGRFGRHVRLVLCASPGARASCRPGRRA